MTDDLYRPIDASKLPGEEQLDLGFLPDLKERQLTLERARQALERAQELLERVKALHGEGETKAGNHP